MKFLEAKKVLASFKGGEDLPFLLAMSGQPEPLEVYVRAFAARLGRNATPRYLPFNTLAQTLLAPARDGELEVFLLFPWDLLPEADWRSGVPSATADYRALRQSAESTTSLLRKRAGARVVYVDAPLPPLSPSQSLNRALRVDLRAAASSLGAIVLEESVMTLAGLLDHGSAVTSAHLGTVASHIIDCAVRRPHETAKVLVTDFDNTLWHGVVGEDGVDGLHFGPQGLGFPHFIFQTYLKTLKGHGVLLAGVTKNDPDLALAPLRSSESVLSPDDFIAIVASYNPKSAQLAELSSRLNLGLESFVFVDDNPVEIAEVSGALPRVHAVPYPRDTSDLPRLLDTLSGLFHREEITSEDLDRTDMYRRMLDGMAPQEVAGSDLSVFLADLKMSLTIHDRSEGDRTRAVQLINKTNQFNLNGLRRSDAEVQAILASGGRLVSGSLSDRHGSHGEILTVLIDGDHVVRSFVMSCRVFQRRVEHAFLVWLSETLPPVVRLEFTETDRNEPIRHFLRDPAFARDGQAWVADLGAFVTRHSDAMDLFQIDPSGHREP